MCAGRGRRAVALRSSSADRGPTVEHVAQARIDRIPQAVANQIEADDEQRNSETWKDGHPRALAHERAARIDQPTERRVGRIDAQPEEAQAGLDKNRGRE